jgi:hypothetical protein
VNYPDLPLLSRFNLVASEWHRRRLDGGRRHPAHYATQDLNDREVVAELTRLARDYASALEQQYAPASRKKEVAVSA